MEKKQSEGITVVIPCLNERETLRAAIAEAKQGITEAKLPGEVVVADNGSTDGSQKIAADAGARVVPVTTRGYGAALHYGISAAAYSYVVFADADLSYPFTELPALIKPLTLGQADLVLGSRLGGTIEKGAMPLLNRYVGTPVLSFFIRLLYGIPISDCNSGMRAIRKHSYELLGCQCPGMEYASEMLVKSAQNKLRYAEVPINFRRDRRNRPPHLRRWRDGWRHLRFILGSAPSVWTLVVPGFIGTMGLLASFIISFEGIFSPGTPMHFHTAYALLALAIPFLLFTLAHLLVRTVQHESGAQKSRIIRTLQKWSEDATPFYISTLFFLAGGVELVRLLYHWYQVGFGHLNEMGGTIRLMVFSVIGTLLFCLDSGLGLLKLVRYEVPNKILPRAQHSAHF